jgi:hypothetical protein
MWKHGIECCYQSVRRRIEEHRCNRSEYEAKVDALMYQCLGLAFGGSVVLTVLAIASLLFRYLVQP